MSRAKEMNRISEFINLESCSKKITLRSGDFKLCLLRGYKGEVRNNFTIQILSKSFLAFLHEYNHFIRENPLLPKLQWVASIKKNIWIGVSQTVFFIAEEEAYLNSDHNEGIIVAPFSLNEVFSPGEFFYVSPDRLNSFMHALYTCLSSPEMTYKALCKDGIISKNLSLWNSIYLFVFVAAKAGIPFDMAISDIKKVERIVLSSNIHKTQLAEVYDRAAKFTIL